jgi:acetylornithine/succinyldiaminopimelate/putrescine aminotransferase
METTDAAQLKPEEIQALEDKYLFATYKRSELFCAHGSGVYVYDLAGKRYLDLLAGISVNSLGYNHPRLVKVLVEQGQRLIHSSNLFIIHIRDCWRRGWRRVPGWRRFSSLTAARKPLKRGSR